MEEKVHEIDEKLLEEKQAFLNKYDPGELDIPKISDMNLHRRMVRTLYLNNLLWATARLQRHVWVAASQEEVYKDRIYSPRRSKEGMNLYAQFGPLIDGTGFMRICSDTVRILASV